MKKRIITAIISVVTAVTMMGTPAQAYFPRPMPTYVLWLPWWIHHYEGPIYKYVLNGVECWVYNDGHQQCHYVGTNQPAPPQAIWAIWYI